MTDPNTWPSCIGEHAATLAKPRNWNAACAATQARQGCDIGSAGRALLADVRGDWVLLRSERDSECQTIHDGAEASVTNGDGSTSLFECGGTINTEGDLGMCGE